MNRRTNYNWITEQFFSLLPVLDPILTNSMTFECHIICSIVVFVVVTFWTLLSYITSNQPEFMRPFFSVACTSIQYHIIKQLLYEISLLFAQNYIGFILLTTVHYQRAWPLWLIIISLHSKSDMRAVGSTHTQTGIMLRKRHCKRS